jgi:microcystin-dependent protein
MNSNKIVKLLNPTSNQDAATKSYVDTSIPVGGIIMWSGTTGTSLPSNWKLCDGSTYNGIKTPDLRGRIVLSSTTQMSANGNIALAGGLSTRNVDQTGGVETVTLTVAQMPSHSHDVSATTNSTGSHNHTVTVTDQGHSHGHSWNAGIPPNIYGGGNRSLPGGGGHTNGTDISISSSTTGIKVSLTDNGDHTHTVSVSETSKGSGQAHENMPPFYVLAFIMRIS